MCDSSRGLTSVRARPCAASPASGAPSAEAGPREPGFEGGEGRGRSTVEQRRPVVGVDEVHADCLRRAAEMQVDEFQTTHNPIFAVADLRLAAMRMVLVLAVALSLVSAAGAAEQPVTATPNTEVRLIDYRAHDGESRPAWLFLPAGYHGQRVPLVISPHGRGVDESDNAVFWGDLPGEGGFALIDPAGEGRRLHWYSWGAPGQIADLARMPAVARAWGVNVNPHRIYAVGGSMGGQETLLLAGRYPHLLAGAAAFDPATDMARRYRDFASLPGGRHLQALARHE